MTGRVIGSSEIKVQRSKESVTGINVKLVTGKKYFQSYILQVKCFNNLAVNLESEEVVKYFQI